MERLTEKRDGQNVIPLRQNGKVKWSICSAGLGDAPTEYLYGEHADRLAAIEDILGDEYDLDRLRELAQADREGKIPRYAIGDTVYDRYGEPWQVVSAELHSMHTKNEWLYRCGHEGTDDYCALWHFEAFPGREAALRRERDGY